VRPTTEESGADPVINWTSFRAAFLCEWLKSKDIRKAMRQAAGAGFLTFTGAEVV